MGKSQRTKGANGERELCALLSDALGQVVKRKLGQARDSGHDIDLPPFRIEVKRRKKIALLYEALLQAVDAMNPEDIPVLMVREDGQKWLCVMFLPDWIAIAREEIAK